MYSVKIGPYGQEIANPDFHWIRRVIEGLRADGLNAAVQVRFNLPGLELRLITPGFPTTGRGMSFDDFNRDEQALILIWQKYKLDKDRDFAPETLLRFLREATDSLAITA